MSKRRDQTAVELSRLKASLLGASARVGKPPQAQGVSRDEEQTNEHEIKVQEIRIPPAPATGGRLSPPPKLKFPPSNPARKCLSPLSMTPTGVSGGHHRRLDFPADEPMVVKAYAATQTPLNTSVL